MCVYHVLGRLFPDEFPHFWFYFGKGPMGGLIIMAKTTRCLKRLVSKVCMFDHRRSASMPTTFCKRSRNVGAPCQDLSEGVPHKVFGPWVRWERGQVISDLSRRRRVVVGPTKNDIGTLGRTLSTWPKHDPFLSYVFSRNRLLFWKKARCPHSRNKAQKRVDKSDIFL